MEEAPKHHGTIDRVGRDRVGRGPADHDRADHDPADHDPAGASFFPDARSVDSVWIQIS